jgi:hypothetical protein
VIYKTFYEGDTFYTYSQQNVTYNFNIFQHEVLLLISETHRETYWDKEMAVSGLSMIRYVSSHKNQEAVEFWGSIIPSNEALKEESIDAAKAVLSKALF